jgi:hypothetical protein
MMAVEKQRGQHKFRLFSDLKCEFIRDYVGIDDADRLGFGVFTGRDGSICHFGSGATGVSIAVIIGSTSLKRCAGIARSEETEPPMETRVIITVAIIYSVPRKNGKSAAPVTTSEQIKATQECSMKWSVVIAI